MLGFLTCNCTLIRVCVCLCVVFVGLRCKRKGGGDASITANNTSSPPLKPSPTYRYAVPLKASVYNISLIYNHWKKKSPFLSEKISKSD